jgi:hypothetical protein
MLHGQRLLPRFSTILHAIWRDVYGLWWRLLHSYAAAVSHGVRIRRSLRTGDGSSCTLGNNSVARASNVRTAVAVSVERDSSFATAAGS